MYPSITRRWSMSRGRRRVVTRAKRLQLVLPLGSSQVTNGAGRPGGIAGAATAMATATATATTIAAATETAIATTIAAAAVAAAAVRHPAGRSIKGRNLPDRLGGTLGRVEGTGICEAKVILTREVSVITTTVKRRKPTRKEEDPAPVAAVSPVADHPVAHHIANRANRSYSRDWMI